MTSFPATAGSANDLGTYDGPDTLGVEVPADVLLLLGVLLALAHGIDVPADVVLLQRVLVDLRVGVDVAADVLLLLGVLVALALDVQ